MYIFSVTGANRRSNQQTIWEDRFKLKVVEKYITFYTEICAKCILKDENC